MKVCFVGYDKPNYHGGPIVNLQRLLPALQERGVVASALIIHHGDHSPAAKLLQSKGVECRVMRWQNQTQKHVRWILSQAYDINPSVFVANVSVPACYAARWIRESGIPTVAAYRGDNRFHSALIEQFVCSDHQWRVSGLLCVSEELKAKVLGVAPADLKIAVIPSGVPVPSLPTAAHQPLRVVYIGRMQEEQKRIQSVIAAMCQIVNVVDGATGLLVGTGPMLSHCKEVARAAGATDRIEFVNGVECGRIQETIRGSSIVLLLSDYEGTPGALMDSMAAGIVPVCRASKGGVSGLVQDGENGILIDLSADDFVDRAVTEVQQLADDQPTWQRLSDNARRSVMNDFSLDVAADKWIDFLDSLAQDAQPKQPIVPTKLDLPPVRQEFVREDVRWWNVYRRTKGALGRFIHAS